jgi:hypothetical protein
MARGSSPTARHAALAGVALAAGGALAATTARLTRGRRPAVAGALRRRLRRRDAHLYTCDCGMEYRVSGTDRHRVYWPADAADDAPVLGDRCVRCDTPLPSGRVGSAA